MNHGIDFLWVYLQTTPLLGLGITLLAYQAAQTISGRFGANTLANPMLIAVGLIVAVLLITGTPYPVYFQGAQYIHVLLGPATVALAVPMYANIGQIRRSAGAILPAILAGSAVAAGSAMAIAHLLGASRQTVLSLAPKSVTTPIAMGIAEQIGGQPSLTAVFVLLTGIVSILLAGPVARVLGVTDWRAIGLAAGTAGHGLATARVLLLNETAGAFGGLAIGLNGLFTSLIVPLLAGILARLVPG